MDGMKQFVISEETFRLKPLEKAPQAESGTAIILYRECAGVSSGMIIFPEQFVMSGSIRIGKYDRKIVIDISEHQLELNTKIKTQEGYSDFLIHIAIKYKIKDVMYAAIKNLDNIQNLILEEAKKFINECQEEFSFEDEIGMERKLDELIKILRQRFLFLTIVVEKRVELDEIGQFVHGSNVKSIAESIVQRNELEVEKVSIQRKEELKRTQYQEDRETLEIKNRLKEAKLEKFKSLESRFGEDALILEAYSNGEISSIELNDKLRKQHQEDFDKKSQILKELYNMDMLSHECVYRLFEPMLLEKSIETIAEENGREVIELKDKVEIQDGDEIGTYMDDSE